jgi:phosphopantothenoylcysteine decarboxylase/phosphopantothenate--cysteine ligase
MNCIVTAGPTYEPLDQVRRLTNFSSGRLGSELANFLAGNGHQVALLIGQSATWRGERRAQEVETFTTTMDLHERLHARSNPAVGAVFHAAAVSDFAFSKVWLRSGEGELTEIQSGKISTRQGSLMAELTPTPKIIQELREWYPQALIAGWKYEVEGTRAQVLRRATQQVADCRTDVCVANGPAYGAGFGLVRAGGDHAHVDDMTALFAALASLLASRS